MKNENERMTTAGICIRDNKVLIGKRIAKGSIGNFWEFPGGKNRWDESVEETLKREFREELDVEVSVGAEIATYDFENKGIHYFLKAHEITILDPSPIFKLYVHTEFRWESIDNLINYKLAPSDRALISQIKEYYAVTK
ncbi:MAG: NUDIX domain-containing protein [Spirochaetaceae bacterium]|nr:NUDIX domain-containing protein [Spirochaetaceae bacterium]